MTDLSKAIILATKAHDGQVDKQGQPYILHPIRVMLACETEKEKIAAALHDVLEDTIITENDLYVEGFSEEIIEAVKSVSRLDPKAERYKDFIQRAKKNPIGKSVKISDLRDNLRDIPNEPAERKEKRLWKYKTSIMELLS